MIRHFITYIFLLQSVVVFGQQSAFELTIAISNFDQIADIVETPSGDFVAATNTYVGSNYDITLIKISSSGLVLSSIKIGTPESEFAKSISITSDGGYFITGYTFTTPSDNDALLIKVDSSFSIEFYKRMGTTPGNDYANEGFEASPGLYTFTGTVAIGGSAKPSRVTLDGAGNVVSEAYLNTNQFASPDYSGTYFGDGLIGFAHLSNAISLVDTNGIIIKNFPFSYGGYTTKIIKSNDNNFVAIGTSGIGAPQGSKLSICKGDSATGVFSLSKVFSFNGYNLHSVGIIQDASGNYYLAGNTENFSNGYSDPFVIKTDSAGNLIWSNQYSPSGSTHCTINSIIATSDGGIMIVGGSLTGGNTDAFIAKIDSAGSSNCNTTPLPVSSATQTPNSSTLHSITAGTISPIVNGLVVDTTAFVTPNLLCFTTGVENVPITTDNIKVYPSVFTQNIFVFVSEPYEQLKTVIYDMTGKKVYSKEINGSSNLNLEHLVPGTYTLFIETKNNSAPLRKKIIKLANY